MFEELGPAAPYLFSFIGTLIVVAVLWIWSRGDLADVKEDLSRLGDNVDQLALARGPVLANGEAVDVLEIAHQLKEVEHEQQRQDRVLRGIAGALGRLHGLPVETQQQDADGKETHHLHPIVRAWLKAVEEGRAETTLEFPEQQMDLGDGMQAKAKASVTIKPRKEPAKSQQGSWEPPGEGEDPFTLPEKPVYTGRRRGNE